MSCLIDVGKPVGSESELSTVNQHCFGLGGLSLSTSESWFSSEDAP